MVETRYVKAGEIELAYETFGDPADRPLLLIHGIATQMIGWPDGFCRALAERGFHVIRFDNRDIGLSTHLAEAGEPAVADIFADAAAVAPYTLEDMADDAAALLDALGIDSAHIVGASMGGMIAQALAARHPQRVRSLTSVFSTPAPAIGAATREALGVLLAPPARNREEAMERSLNAYRVIGSPAYELDEAAVRHVAGRAYDRAYDPPGVTRQLAAIHASGDRTAALRTITAPTLVIHGEADPLVQLAGARATAEAIAGAELVTYPGMGHNLPIELWPDITGRIAALADRAGPA